MHLVQASADDVLDEDRNEYLDPRVVELVGGFLDPTLDRRGLLWVGLSPRVAAAIPHAVAAVRSEISRRSFACRERAEMPWSGITR